VCVSSLPFDVPDNRFSGKMWRIMSTDLRVLFSVCVRAMKTNLVHSFFLSLFCQSTSTSFGQICISSGSVYIYLYSVFTCCSFQLTAVGRPTDSQLKNKQSNKDPRHPTLIISSVDTVIFPYVLFDFSLGHFQQRVAFVQRLWKVTYLCLWFDVLFNLSTLNIMNI
jgi:hypothetical protein